MVVFAALHGGAHAQTRLELTMAQSEQDVMGETLRWWIGQVGERTGGSVIIEPVYNGALASAPETLDAVADGVVPLGMGVASFMAGVVPQFSYAELLGTFPSEDGVTERAMLEIWPDIQEFMEPHGVVALWGEAALEAGVICRDGFLLTPEDWAGKSVRVAGRWQSRQVEALGAQPVTVPTGEIYIALQNRLVDCALMNPAIINSQGLYEVAPYFTNLGLTVNINVALINQHDWDSLTSEERDIITEVSRQAMTYGGLRARLLAEVEAIEAAGGRIHRATPEEREAFLERSEPVFAEVRASVPGVDELAAKVAEVQ